jgi:hypothetical protein
MAIAGGRSGGLQIVRRRFSGPSVGDNLIKDLLSLVEAVHPSALDGADVHENILAAVIGLDEAKAFLAVEPLYGSLRHETFLSGTCLDRAAPRAQPVHSDRDFGKKVVSPTRSARRSQVVRPKLD